MNFLVNYNSDDEKDSRSEGSERKYKPDAYKIDNQRLTEFGVERKKATSSRDKKSSTQSTNQNSFSQRSCKHEAKERKQHHSYDDEKAKDRKKEGNSHRTERHKEKSKDNERETKTSDYNFKHREHHSHHRRYEKYRREKRETADDRHFKDKHRRRHSTSPREKRDYNDKDSIRKCKETAVSTNESEIHKNIDTKEHKNNVQNIVPTVSNSLLTSPCNIPAPLKTPEQQEIGIKLPSYYNPSVINPNKFAEQVQKRKLLWANKKDEETAASKWGGAKFAQDSDGKVASKFMRLMGIKSAPKLNDENQTKIETTTNEHVQEREAMFSSMEQQYEVARQVTHTMRGVGLGFSSQSKPF